MSENVEHPPLAALRACTGINLPLSLSKTKDGVVKFAVPEGGGWLPFQKVILYFSCCNVDVTGGISDMLYDWTLNAWNSFVQLIIHRDDHFGNVKRLRSFLQASNLATLDIREDPKLK
jgi:hypothetical protein